MLKSQLMVGRRSQARWSHPTVFAVIGLVFCSRSFAGESIEVPDMVLKLVEQADVPAREAGVLNVLNVREGQAVDKGFLLGQIDDADARIAVDRAKVDLVIAKTHAENDINVRFSKKSLDVARSELARSLESINRFPKSVSESEMDRLKLLVEKSSLEVEQAQHDFAIAGLARQIKMNELQGAEQKASEHQIIAPIKGIVVQISHHPGEWVKPGETLLRILRVDRLRAEGDLKAQYLGKLTKGREVQLTVELPQGGEVKVPGTVVFLDPQIEPLNAKLRIWVEFANADLKLLPGMHAKLSIDAP